MKETILLIDDEPLNLNTLSRILSAHGLEIMAVRSGEAGLELVASARPDLILLDIRMPGLDGFEVCRRLKTRTETRDIPIIFTTILADLDNKMEGFKLGAVDYIAKPFEAEEVVMRVERHLQLHRLQCELKKERAELANRNAELRAFAHTVSHSLKNPLGRVAGMLELLDPSAADFTARAARLLPLIKRSIRCSLLTTDALLKLAEISQSKLEQTLQAVDVKNCATRALETLEEDNAAETVWLNEPWPQAVGYAPWIEEIWRNYLDNALKYGAPPLHIGARSEGEFVEYWLQDHGPGLDSVEQALLFSPFTRLHGGQTEGHGLGLSIVRRIAERLGGEAGISCVPGKGCRVYFRLPVAG